MTMVVRPDCKTYLISNDTSYVHSLRHSMYRSKVFPTVTKTNYYHSAYNIRVCLIILASTRFLVVIIICRVGNDEDIEYEKWISYGKGIDCTRSN